MTLAEFNPIWNDIDAEVKRVLYWEPKDNNSSWQSYIYAEYDIPEYNKKTKERSSRVTVFLYGSIYVAMERLV